MKFPGIFTPQFLSLLLIFVILGSCKKNTDTPYLDDSDIIISYMNNTRVQIQAPGWIVGVKTPSVYHEYAGGKANLEENIGMIPSDLLRIGSISKTFTATLALILCDEGMISLDETLDNYYPAFQNSDEITISHLLKHTSGLVTWDENEDIRMQIYNGTGDWTIDKLIEWAQQQDTLSSPGKEFHYSNIGYFLLGKIMEEASGYSISELLETKICIPLSLFNTFMPVVPHPAGETIHGYDGSSGSVNDMTGTPQADAINFDLAWTAGGIISSLDDLSVWSRALAGGELISDSLHMLQMPELNPPSSTLPYWSGYGMGISQTDAWIGHTGAICGFVCNMQYKPDDDVSIITFYNKFSAFDVTVNAADLAATSQNFVKLARLMCPETLIH